jgi:hypothetical protein
MRFGSRRKEEAEKGKSSRTTLKSQCSRRAGLVKLKRSVVPKMGRRLKRLRVLVVCRVGRGG